MVDLVNFLNPFTNRTTRSTGSVPENPRTITVGEARRVFGHTGTAIFGGFIVERENNARLQGQQKYRTFSEILTNTSIVAAGTRYFLNLLSKAQWNVEPAGARDEALLPQGEETRTGEQSIRQEPVAINQADAEEIATAIREIINSMETTWPRVVRRAGMYRFYGFSLQEWTAVKRDDGIIGMLDVAPRPQLTIERWGTDVTGRVLNVIQRSEQTAEEILLPRNKLVYVVDDSLNDSPEGLGLFRHLAEPVQRLRRYEELEGFSFEADLRGIPIGRAPFAELEESVKLGKISNEEKAELENGLVSFMQKHIKNPQLGLILDSSVYRSLDDNQTPSSTPKWAIDALEASGTGQEALLRAIERVNREIARVMGVEGLLLGEGDRGSQALSRDKSHNFALIVDSTLRELAEVFERDIIKPIMRLNGWDEVLAPTLKPEAVQYRDIEQITQSIRDLAMSGINLQPTDSAVGEIFDLIGLSRPDPEAAERDILEGRAFAARMFEGMAEGDPETVPGVQS